MALPAAKLQKIDRWVGIPACAIFTLWRRIIDALVPRRAPEKPQRILFVKFAEQGSTVLAYAALKRAVQIFGRENVFFIVFQENRFILDVLGLIPEENVIAIQTRSLFGAAFSALAALKKCRDLKIDSAVDLEFFSRSSAIITWLTGAMRRVGFHTYFGEGPYRGDLMTHRLLYNPYFHTVQIFRMMIEALEKDGAKFPTFDLVPAPTESELASFVPRPGEQDEVRKILRDTSGGEVKRLLLLNPNASDLLPLRKWETPRYIELARRLLEKYPDAHVAMTGAPDEAESAARVAREVGSPRCFSLAGKTTLRQLMVLYTLSDLLVTNDSGPAHFAAMTPVHVVTLFGPETPRLFGAPTPRNTVIWLGLACSPCVNAYNNRQSACRDNICMKQITVDQVFDASCRALEKRSQTAAGA
jgi:ADP-heptose:LPS heptosyltransferase